MDSVDSRKVYQSFQWKHRVKLNGNGATQSIGSTGKAYHGGRVDGCLRCQVKDAT